MKEYTSCASFSLVQKYLISIALKHCCLLLLLAMPTAVPLLQWTGVFMIHEPGSLSLPQRCNNAREAARQWCEGRRLVTEDGKMEGAEGGRGRRRARRRRASGGKGHPWTTAPTTPSRGGTHSSTSPGAGTICPGGPRGGPRGEEGMTAKVWANGRQSGGGEAGVVHP